MNRPVVVGFVVVLLATSALAANASYAVSADAPTDAEFGTQSQDFDSSIFEITVHEDGSATWTFRHTRILSNQSEVDDFETFADRFESEETDLYERFQMTASSLVSTGKNETDRGMEATDFERSAHVEDGVNRFGVVEMTFTWHGFAVVDDGTVTVSDVFDGRLPLLSDQTMTVVAGDGLEFETISPDEPDAEYVGSLESADSVSWSGEMEFSSAQPYVVLVPETGAAGGTASDGTDSLLAILSDRSVLALGALTVVLVVGVIALGRTRADDRSLADGLSIGALRGRADDPATSGVDGDPAVSGAGDGQTGGTDEPADADGGTDEGANGGIPDAEFVTDEDRVVSLISHNGGRMKQVNIVEETGWSKSKVSMLLSEMEETGTISKLRVGRENIISLDGFEPEATKSPFDE